MKILAFILAVIVGGLVWSFTFGLIHTFITGGKGGGLITLIFLYLLFMTIRYFYKKFVVKFGYKLDENIAEDDKKVKNTLIRLIIYFVIFIILFFVIIAVLAKS